jgi:hypothetical protein
MRRFTLPFFVLTAVALGSSTASGATAEDVVLSLGVPAADTVSIQLSEGSQDMLGSVSSQGVITATDAPMGLIYTGRVNNMTSCQDDDMQPSGQNGDTATIRVQLTAPAGMHSFKFNFYFLSREYPDFVGSAYNDVFSVSQQSSVYNGNITFDQGGNVIDVNTALFSVTNQALLTGTGFDCGHRGGGTGWLTTISPCVPGETFTLMFTIGDLSDGIYDSAVFIDGFEWREQEEKEPHAAEPISLKFLSPKVGPTSGGQTTVIYGNEFDADSHVSFDGQEIGQTDISLLSSERLQVITPAHAEGMVDIRVWSDIFDDTLSNGYTFSDAAAGTLPPELVEITPAIGPIEGGINVTILGGNLQPGTSFFFDGLQADCSVNPVGIDAACDLPAYQGEESQAVVVVEAVNPSGVEAMPPLTFTYSAEVAPDDYDGGGDACSCDQRGRGTARTGVLALILLLALAMRRGREV